MNERIRELAEQAKRETSLYGGKPGDREFDERFNKMFAELIVEECVKLNGKELAMAGHSRMVDVYCEHFGIEYQ